MLKDAQSNRMCYKKTAQSNRMMLKDAQSNRMCYKKTAQSNRMCYKDAQTRINIEWTMTGASSYCHYKCQFWNIISS